MYAYTYKRRLHWSECDPAGIIYFPIYARWISEGLDQMFLDNGIDPSEITHDVMVGLPAVALSMKFHSAPKLHDIVSHRIKVDHLGGKSLRFQHQFYCQDTLLMEAEDTRIWTTHTLGKPDTLKSADIPPLVRALLETHNT